LQKLPVPVGRIGTEIGGSFPCHCLKRVSISWAATVSWLIRAAVAFTL
jgi:hypothetical protein